MITKEWIQGYIQALDNVNSMLTETTKDVDSSFNQGLLTHTEYLHLKAAYKSVKDYIEDVKGNYRNLVKEQNEKNK